MKIKKQQPIGLPSTGCLKKVVGYLASEGV